MGNQAPQFECPTFGWFLFNITKILNTETVHLFDLFHVERVVCAVTSTLFRLQAYRVLEARH